MPIARFKQLDEDKKINILETALDAFIENNFTAASINKISKAAGLSAGALYYYFEDKEDLFYTTLDYAKGDLFKEFGDLGTLFETHGYWEGIKVFVLKRFELNQKHARYMRLFQRILLSKDNVELKGRDIFLSMFKEIFEYGYNNGYIRSDLPKEFLFDMHFNMIITINQWMLKDYEKFLNKELAIEDLIELSITAVGMIKSAMKVREDV
ncbi:MAG: TetR/AcrR family transcriptional regulator [Acidaminobacteraceae bacterium]